MASRRPQLAKLTRPRLHKAVARERLFTLLDEAREHQPAICVVGPPGAGKTTLVASWLDARNLKGIWYQVDPGDADLATFFYYLGEAAKPFTRKGQRPLPLLTPEYLQDVEGFSRRFFRELFARLPEGATLVLDNYQEVPALQAFHELIAEAVAEVPPGIALICVSRRDPPDCYVRLTANGKVAFVDWDELRLTLQEAASIVLEKDGDIGLTQELHEKSGGWAAGLVLMVENRGTGNKEDKYDQAVSQQLIFNYFADQIFNRLPDGVRDFLLATSDLPWLNAGLGELLTGSPAARGILDDLCSRHLFVHKRSGNEPTYQYHALFQEFLRSRADLSLQKDKRNELRCLGAEAMEQSNNIPEAFKLYRDAQAWTAASHLILRHAADCIAHGRFLTLADWVAALPEAVVRANPWLAYWHGRALVPLDPTSGRQLLEVAYAGFSSRADHIGETAAAASIIDSIFIENRYFVAMDPWIEILESKLQATSTLPSRAMELRIHASVLVAALYRRPASPLVSICLERLIRLLEIESDANARASAGLSVLIYASASGDFQTGRRVKALIDPIVCKDEVVSAHRFLWHCWCGYFLMLVGEYVEAMAHYRMAEEMNGANEFPWSANLLYVKGLCEATSGNTDAALEIFKRMEVMTNRSRPQDMGYLHMARAWTGIASGDAELALRESRAAIKAAEDIGNFSLTIIWLTPAIWALVVTGRYEEFMLTMKETLERVQGTCYRRPHVELCAMEAWVHLRKGDRKAAGSAMDEALRLAKSHDHGALFHRTCSIAPELRTFAVEVGGADVFLRSLVRKFNWRPCSPVAENWPWPIRVQTLGRFVVMVDDEPLAFGRKAPRKSILLLKAIIAFGERGVAEQKLIDALWPDQEGDAGRHALALSLHRLRRLLGHQEAIIVVDGVLALNSDIVWTDVRALEALFEGENLEAENRMAGLLKWYRGTFLEDEIDASWTVSMRERLRLRFIHSVEQAGSALEGAGRFEAAIALYVRGLDADPLAEIFYQGLIRCYVNQGRKAEAFSTYRSLRQTLSIVLGIQPAPSTEALVRQLRTAC